MYRVIEGGYFGEMQLLHGCDIYGCAKAAEDSLVWIIDEDMFTQFRGMTFQLLQTVAARLKYCQDLSGDETKQLVPPTGKPCYLDQTQVRPFSALVNPDDDANQSNVAINCKWPSCGSGRPAS